MGFSRSWTAELLTQPPMIAPARSYVWPMRIEGEEDALARGAVNVMVRSERHGSFLVTAALGFKDPSMPSGVFACPKPDEICIVAGGYVYLADISSPEHVTLLEMKPTVEVIERVDEALLVLIGFTSVMAWGVEGKAWETPRLSWEGLRLTGFADSILHGFGWDLIKDQEVAFEIDLKTGKATGGAYRSR